MPSVVLESITPDLARFGGRVVEDILQCGNNIEENQPKLKQYDHWSRRVDELTTSEGWRRMHDIAAEEGLVAIAYERKYAEFSRLYQFTKIYLFAPSSSIYDCPLSMTDGAARVIELIGDNELKEEVYPRLTSRDPCKFWTSGQWMTERPGGSDVGLTETLAEPIDPAANVWRIDGFKWFSSATDANITMLLARGKDPKTGEFQHGSKGLSLYFAQVRTADNKLNGVRIHRLKSKFGTKGLPTAELELVNMKGKLIGEFNRGVPNISHILNITRIYSALGCTAFMRRSLYLAKEYAHKRKASGAYLSELPLHVATLAELELKFRGALQFVFYSIQLLGKSEASVATLDEINMLRLVTPIVKLWCAKQSVQFVSECMETLGGQGYMEETGIAKLLRDTQVNTIWEGTTNVLSLDVLRVLHRSKGKITDTLVKFVESKLLFEESKMPPGVVQILQEARNDTRAVLKQTVDFIHKFSNTKDLEAMARKLAFVLANIIISVLLVEHACWSQRHQNEHTSQRDLIAAKNWGRSMKQSMEELIQAQKDTRSEDHLLVFGKTKL
ncbi:acyl-CoA dehydrogenase/oxidase C-terminal [Basidiobolus meristosporus CBS 931.73]|uniref:Acyl-CoA dehydrogenase/oxidase C-terminal n=1 Tax=Basidiobolus meristosporus CBS 931.73 TaxID=1314790 RepID=A0A1Y1Z3Z9_9FUNG|nr:acyl-CoA dehydrogenase/oxidase C-terminal [Basidiobolus meristosporus CBS 931.73]|eukprot:ORY04992.1 acyl-CoA dehydrogenase/oxidase C-terminal [Basidiobolus meristosporus CBS 931.73]